MEIEDSVGFNIGQDMYLYRQAVQDDMPSIVRDGFNAAKKRSPKTIKPDRYVLRWLQIRRSAFKRGIPVDIDVTPTYLLSIDMFHGCPVTGVVMTTATNKSTDASVDRVVNSLGYTRGNIVYMATFANEAKGDLSPSEIRAVAATNSRSHGLEAAHWRKLEYMVDVIEEHQKGSQRMFLRGERYVPGLPYGPTAELQSEITKTLRSARHLTADEALYLFHHLVESLAYASQRKSVIKAYKKMMMWFLPRSNRVQADTWEYWSDSRNIRRLEAWWKILIDSERAEIDKRLKTGRHENAVKSAVSRDDYSSLKHFDESDQGNRFT